MSNCWRVWGERYGYFALEKDAQVFYNQLVYSIAKVQKLFAFLCFLKKWVIGKKTVTGPTIVEKT